VEARQAQFAAVSKTAEDTRVQLRSHHDAGIRKFGFPKRSRGAEVVRFAVCIATLLDTYDVCVQFKKLMDEHVSQIDSALAALKKSTGLK